MLITKKIEIDMGHRVPNHKSKCYNIHGHRYTFMVGVDDKVIKTKGASDEGMVIDFGDLKSIMMDQIDARLDHGFMIYKDDPMYALWKKEKFYDKQKVIPVDYIPTVENIARDTYFKMERPLTKKGIAIAWVKVWETPNSTAIYTKADMDLEGKLK